MTYSWGVEMTQREFRVKRARLQGLRNRIDRVISIGFGVDMLNDQIVILTEGYRTTLSTV